MKTPIEAVDEALRKVIESAPTDPAAVIGASLAHSMLTLMRIPATFLSNCVASQAKQKEEPQAALAPELQVD